MSVPDKPGPFLLPAWAGKSPSDTRRTSVAATERRIKARPMGEAIIVQPGGIRRNGQVRTFRVGSETANIRRSPLGDIQLDETEKPDRIVLCPRAGRSGRGAGRI